jgi:hypothetical protein
MERRFNDDGFEQFLRDATEHFRMYPTKKVWHSIYNDIHPSRKWPSLSALLILITSVMFIGVSNTRTKVSKDAAYIAALNLQLEPITLSATETSSTTSTVQSDYNNRSSATLDGNESNSIAGTAVQSENISLTTQDVADVISVEDALASTVGSDVSEDEFNLNKRSSATSLNSAFALQVSAPQSEFPVENESADNALLSNLTVTDTPENDIRTANIDSEISATETPETDMVVTEMPVADKSTPTDDTPASTTMNETIHEEDKIKFWIDEYAFYNLRNKKQKKSPWSYHAYVTPSFGYRTLHNDANFTPESFLTSTLIANSATTELELVHNPAINFELGGGVYYQLNRTVRLKGGLQMNFTNYKINAFGLSHAGMATVMMNTDIPQNPTIETRPTFLSTIGTGNEIQLNSSTMQFSVPIGADVRLGGNKQITWYAGATIQPTYVAGGNAFIVSADHKHYIADATILRRFNMNTSVETFISYQPMKGVRLQLGPQFRYQLMSTYIQDYPMKERLYNIGIKMGITTRF